MRRSKTKKIILIVSLSLLVLSILGVIVVSVLLSDKTRNKYTPREITPTQVLSDNYINGLKDISTTGKFNFSLSNDDINETLSFASKKINNDNIKSIYYDAKDNHHYFYVDLNKKLFTDTRVVISTSASKNESDQSYTLSINSCKIGKLDVFSYLKDKGYFAEGFISLIRKYSLLPIYSNFKSENTFTLKTKDFSLYSPFKDGFGRALFSEAESIFESTGLFSFSYDFSSFRRSDHIASKEIEGEVIDIEARFKSALSDDFLNSIAFNETKVASSFTFEEYSSLFRHELSLLEKEEYSSSDNLTRVVFKVSDIQLILKDDYFLYNFVISVNGYEVDASLKTYYVENATHPRVYFEKPVDYCFLGEDDVNHYCSNYSFIYSSLFDSYEKVFGKVSQTYYGFATYNLTLFSFSIDFINVVEELNISTSRFHFALSVDETQERFLLNVTNLVA